MTVQSSLRNFFTVVREAVRNPETQSAGTRILFGVYKAQKILSDCFTGPSNPSSTSKNSKADSEKEEEATSGEDDDSDAESWHSFESEYDDARSVIPEEELEEETSETAGT